MEIRSTTLGFEQQPLQYPNDIIPTQGGNQKTNGMGVTREKGSD